MILFEYRIFTPPYRIRRSFSIMNTYDETIKYLYSRLPMYQRVGSIAYKPGLDNIKALCHALGNPQSKTKFIHIAGTNGKGSVSHYLASILQCAGYKNVGLHTSPHLKDFRERIRINGVAVAQEKIVDFVNTCKNTIEILNPSFFEISVAMAFYFFAEAKSEIAVIETGLGGRLDSTNIITPELSVITNISFDHTATLGNTLAKIAYEKAGIIKPGVPVVIGETNEETKPVFEQKAIECNSPIYFADKEYKAIHPKVASENGKPFLRMDIYINDILKYPSLRSELCGLYQLKNIPAVLASVDILNERVAPHSPKREHIKANLLNKPGHKLTDDAVKKGLAEVITQTGLLGRWQTLCDKPLTIADTGHNEAGIKEVLAQLSALKYNHLHFVFGMVNDKEYGPILKRLPQNALYYFCKANIPRALDEKKLVKYASEYGLAGSVFPTVKEALNAAQANAQKDDIVLVGGSTFVVAEAI